jgi:hypothetical protein
VQSDESSDESSLLIRAILAYVIKHPDAKDTVDGIHKFWLSDKTAHQSSHKLEQVLDFLAEDRCWLTRKAVSSRVTLYGVNKDRIHEIRNFLGDS